MTSPLVIAVAHLKGGAGKTTVTLTLASTWHQQGLRVLVIDTDPQGTVSDWAALGQEMGHDLPETIDVPARNIQRAVTRQAKHYDIIVIDTPPRLAEATRLALLAAGDHKGIALVPMSPGAGDKWALPATLDVLSKAQELRPGLTVVSVWTRMVRTLAAEGLAASAAEDIPALGARLGHRTAVVEAQLLGTGVVQHEPRSEAADEARTLCREVLRMRKAS